MNEPKYCKSCGAYVPDGAKKCLACGFPLQIPELMSEEGKAWFRDHKSLFKPLNTFSPEQHFDCLGYEVDKNGNVFSMPDDDADEIPMAPLSDKQIYIPIINSRPKFVPKESRVEIKRFEKPNLDWLYDLQKQIAERRLDSFYDDFLQIDNEVKQNIAASREKERADKPDIDFDDLLSKQFFTVKIGGQVSTYYFGKTDMEIGQTIYHSRDAFGKVVRNVAEKKKLCFTMVER